MEFPKSKFSEWFTEVLSQGEIVDMRYPVKGMPVYMPWGFAALRNIFSRLEAMLESTGHRQAMFPLLAPEELLARESHMLEGFSPQVFWVQGLESRVSGTSVRDPRPKTQDPKPHMLAIRPTSETILYTMYSLWVRSYKDLPLRIHQTVSIYRNETKATRPLIRGREIYWNEAHTVHATREDAERQISTGVKIYSGLYDALGISYLTLMRPEFDKFPGAEYSIAFDTLLPDGKTLQIATVHYLGTNFSKAYGINYKNEKNESVPAFQTTYGISMRALAAVIGAHGDEKGLVFPSAVAPVQAVIVPFGHELAEEAKSLAAKLGATGLKCEVDSSGKRPGEKFYYWEARGVPLRIELGKKEMDEKKMKLALRTGEKLLVPLSSVDEIARLLTKQDSLLALAHEKYLEENTYKAESPGDLKRTGFARVGWCQNEACARKIKETGMEIRGTIYGETPKEKKCIVCGKDGTEWVAGNPY